MGMGTRLLFSLCGPFISLRPSYRPDHTPCAVYSLRLHSPFRSCLPCFLSDSVMLFSSLYHVFGFRVSLLAASSPIYLFRLSGLVQVC